MKGKTMKKTLVSMLVFAMASSVAFGLGTMAAAEDETDLTCAHVYENGFCELTEGETHYEEAVLNDNGTAEDTADDYYEIGNAGQLYWFAELVNTEVIDGDATTYPNASANAKLTANIVVNEDVIVGNVNEIEVDEEEVESKGFRSWTPIANNDSYKGVFDGDGHFISGLYVYKEEEKVGLFSSIIGGTVKNVGVKDSFLRIRSTGNAYLGSIAGYTVKEATIENCFSENNYIRGGDKFVGGIIGYCDVSGQGGGLIAIKNCYNTSKVMAYQFFGGIVGSTNNAVVIENCYNLGTIAPHDKTVGEEGERNKLYYGGLVGRMMSNSSYFQNAMMLNCYNLGDIELPDKQRENNIGGLVGIIINSTASQIVIKNCYNGSDFFTTDGGGLPTGVADRCIYSDIGYIEQIEDVSISNVFYPEGRTTNFRITTGTTAVTAEQFANGWLAYMLQAGQTAEEDGGEIPEVWGQTLSGDNADAFPVLGGKKVNYGFTTCSEEQTEKIYTNGAVTEVKPEHDMADATHSLPSTCSVCDKTEGDALGHSYGTAWESDEDEHWNECSCGEKANVADHADGDNDGDCDICEYNMTSIKPGSSVAPKPKKSSGCGNVITATTGGMALIGAGFVLFSRKRKMK